MATQHLRQSRTSHTIGIWLLAALLGPAEIAGAAKRDNKSGTRAPDFSLKDERGKTHKLSDYRGKVVVLEWTNPQCPFVKRHYREGTMSGTAKRFGSKRVVWLAVNSSHFADPKESRAWRAQHKLPYPALHDASGKIGRAYGARTTPHMFVVDAKGIIRYDGAIDDDPHDEKKTPRNYVSEAIGSLERGKRPKVSATAPYGCSVKYRSK